MKYEVEELSKKINKEKTIKAGVKVVVITILTILLIVNLTMLYEHKRAPNEIVSFVGISVFNIISESMEPTINENDVILIKQTNIDEIKEGDIVTFKKHDGTIVTHRIIKIVDSEEGRKYITKGDNNQDEDKEPVEYSQIYGKYIFKISKIGTLIEELQKNNGVISAITIMLIIVILKNSNDKKKERRKMVRQKYEIKKKRDSLKNKRD